VTDLDFQRVAALFEDVRALTADARARVLAQRCASAPDLRREVEELLSFHDDPSAGLDRPLARITGAPTWSSGGGASASGGIPLEEAGAARPQRIGPYRVLRVLGEGGMGVVYLAEQDSPRRAVALKVIRPGVASPAALRRFAQEAAILARLQHPGIAQIYEAGTAVVDSPEGATGSARPFFAMELVHGASLLDYARSRALPTRERLELMIRVCDAVQHAHQKGVIHRDLKPGNILVTDAGQPKILDFGVARVTDADVQMTTLQTEVGQLVGTLPYMSPEQAGAGRDTAHPEGTNREDGAPPGHGDPLAIDTRADVYALGVIAFELLAGRLPYALDRRSVPDAMRVIRDEEPTRLGAVDRSFRGDLETIVGKALEKDRSRRYQTVADLAADIRRTLDDEPIVARPPSAAYQLRKFAKRHRLLVGSAAAIVLALLVAVVVVSLALARAVAAEQDATARLEESRRQTEMAAAVNDFLEEMLASVDPARAQGPDVRVRDVLEWAAARVEKGEVRAEAEIRAALRLTIGWTYRALGLVAEAEPHLREALAIRRSIPRTDESAQLGLAEALDSLAEALRDLGRAAEAEPLSREGLEIRQRVLARDHIDVANSMNNLGLILKDRGDYDGAEVLYRGALDMKRRILSPDDPELCATLMNLGMLRYVAYSDLDGAEALGAEALDVARRAFGPDHPYIAHCLAAVGSIRSAKGDLDGAITLLREALDMRRRVYEGDHVDLAVNLSDLGLALKRKGDLDAAEPLYREALDMRRRLFGSEHASIATSLQNLGMLLRDRGDAAGAEAMVREGLRMRRAVQGEQHVDVAFSLVGLGLMTYANGRFDEAESLFREALEIRLEVLGPRHLDVAVARANLGVVHRAVGRLAESETELAEAHEIRRALLPAGHRDVAVSGWHLGMTRILRGDFMGAEPVLREALELRRATLPARHADVAAAALALGEALLGLERAGEAESLLREALGIRREKLAAGDWQIAEAECLLGMCLVARGDDAEGAALAEPALDRLAAETAPAAAARRRWALERPRRLRATAARIHRGRCILPVDSSNARRRTT
jgi:serine/threonine protein kinase/Flp pilus assembly protein TadD